MVGYRHRRVGPANLAAGELEPFEGLRRRDLVDQVQVDIDQVRAFALRGDDVVVPDLVEEGARLGHGFGHSDWLLSSTAPAISGAGSAWGRALAPARLAPGRTLSRARSVMRAALAGEASQVIELGPPHHAAAHHIDRSDARRI